MLGLIDLVPCSLPRWARNFEHVAAGSKDCQLRELDRG